MGASETTNQGRQGPKWVNSLNQSLVGLCHTSHIDVKVEGLVSVKWASHKLLLRDGLILSQCHGILHHNLLIKVVKIKSEASLLVEDFSSAF